MKFTTAFIAVALLTPSLAVNTARSSPNFGPDLPHRVYHAPSLIDPASSLFAFNAAAPSRKPLEAALQFVRSITDSQIVVQPDYYTDDHTGVTHVYVRQHIHGIPVVDGDINVNVDANGRILSFGNSFYPGESTIVNHHEIKTTKLSNALESLRSELDQVKESLKSLLHPKPASRPVENHHYHSLSSSNSRVVFEEDDQVFTIQMVEGESEQARHDREQLIDLHLQQMASLKEDIDVHKNSLKDHLDQSPRMVEPVEALSAFLDKFNLVSNQDLSQVSIQMTQNLRGEPQAEIHNVPGALSPVKARRAYVQVPNDSGNGMKLAMIWDLEIEMENNWFNAHVDAFQPDKVHAVHDWVKDASYTVFPFGVNDPRDGDRKTVVDPHFPASSPFGWHQQGKKGKKFTNTIGNNAYAQENFEGQYNWEDNYRPEGGKHLTFDFGLNLTSKPKEYIDASVTSLFYTINMVHDLFYQYGFNEKAGNFQEDNNGKGGLGGDSVIANAQDGSGYNNANFATPPDGQHGKMRSYVWDVIDPYRDGVFESGITIHEYAHGISTRLTGGPANSNCLGWGEAGGMGEGWGDFFATVIRMNPKMHNYTSMYDMGSWANGGDGIRSYPYTTDLSVNPESYKVMDQPGYWGVHSKGQVWAGMLYEVVQLLIEKHGMGKSLFPPSDEKLRNTWYRKGTNIPQHGNTLAMQLVVDGMKLQPCRPSFMDARDAILQADEILTGGENKCLIWEGFAKRGLGPKAELVGSTPWGGGVRTEDRIMPKKCHKSKNW